MRKSANRSAPRSKKKRGTKVKKHRLPAMFKIMPLRRRAQPRRNARALMDPVPNPCPPNCTCRGSIQIGQDDYWICVNPDGSVFYVLKN